MEDLLQPRDVATLETVRFVRAHSSAPARVLEVGCGTGEVAAVLARDRTVVALDSSPASVAAAQRRGVDARVASWPANLSEEPFDAVLFTRSLHHIEALDRGVSCARAVLVPSGQVLVEDFAYSQADASARRWLAERARALSAKGHLSPPADSLVARLLASDDPERAWDEEHEHGHELHTAAAMERSLRAHFSDVRGERAPYLYRYFLEALPQDRRGVDLLRDLLAEERALGEGTAIGRRWVARA